MVIRSRKLDRLGVENHRMCDIMKSELDDLGVRQAGPIIHVFSAAID